VRLRKYSSTLLQYSEYVEYEVRNEISSNRVIFLVPLLDSKPYISVPISHCHQQPITTMKFTIATLLLGLTAVNAVDLTPDNYDELTAGKSF
jgi:hypothetical protein